jgi:hypothetical protein
MDGIVDRCKTHFASLAPNDFHDHDVTSERVTKEWSETKPEHWHHEELVQVPEDTTHK